MIDPFGGLLQPWSNAQRPMTEVTRWGNFPEYGQKLVEHTNSAPFVLWWVQVCIGPRTDIDWLFLSQALLVHDHGEPISGGDEHAGNKTDGKELQEYLAFSNLLEAVDPAYRSALMRAFLLQYVRKPQWWPELSSTDWGTVVTLAKKFEREARIFDLVERVDYLASAVIGHRNNIRNDEEFMIDHVLKNQVPKLDALVQEDSLLARAWSPQLRQKLIMLRTSYSE